MAHLWCASWVYWFRVHTFTLIKWYAGITSNKSCQLLNVLMVPLHLVSLIRPVHGIQLELWTAHHLQLQLPFQVLWILFSQSALDQVLAQTTSNIIHNSGHVHTLNFERIQSKNQVTGSYCACTAKWIPHMRSVLSW